MVGLGGARMRSLCNAARVRPQDYAGKLFGGVDFVPDIPSLQAWLECAWRQGFDPDGASQLGGHVQVSLWFAHLGAGTAHEGKEAFVFFRSARDESAWIPGVLLWWACSRGCQGRASSCVVMSTLFTCAAFMYLISMLVSSVVVQACRLNTARAKRVIALPESLP